MRGQGRTVVVGGGLAGIAAAVRLADAGRAVVLLEARPRLGGAAASFDRDGVRADTGQHVILRCYTAYRGLLSRMGVADLVPLQERLEIPVLLPGGDVAVLRRGRSGPAPLHLLPALARYAALTPWQRLTAMRAAVALGGLDPANHRLDAATFGSWLREHGQDEVTMRRLWGLVTVAALNIDPDSASLALAAKVFRTGLLEEVTAGDIGIPAAPLSALHEVPAGRLLQGLGVTVHTRVKVTGLACDGSRMTVRTRSGADRQAGELVGDDVVLAVPHQQAARLVPADAAPDRERWAALGASPIVNAHVHLDRRVTGLAFAAAPDSPAQWVFDRTAAAGLSEGQYLVTSVSAADDIAALPADEICRQQLAALTALLPLMRTARVREAFVTREPRATFRQAAGTASRRPATHTRWPRLALAGAWTATGWPDTMEGAVRSGLAAADALLASLATLSTRQRTEVTT